MIKQECIGIPDMILLLMIFLFQKKIKIKTEIVLSPGGAYFRKKVTAVFTEALKGNQFDVKLTGNAFLFNAIELKTFLLPHTSLH